MDDDKALLDAMRPFAVEDRARSWWHVTTSFALLPLAVAATYLAPIGPAKVVAAALEGLVLVRLFVLFHDHLHGALLRDSRVARLLFAGVGFLLLTPPRVWRETHNYHHAHNAKIVGSNVGSFALVTTGMWARMSPRDRLVYRVVRHPLTIACAYVTMFVYGMCIAPLVRAPRKNVAGLLALAVQAALAVAVIRWAGAAAYLFAVFLPMAIAMALGAYLFYAQHTFPGVVVQPRESWSYARAALASSSYMRMGPIMRYFTGNIGFHHVHHLHPGIPFYRLPEAMRAIPALQSPMTTSLAPRDVVACLRLKLWDPTAKAMVPYPPRRPA